MKSASHLETTAAFLRAISQPVKLEILLAIGTGEACVCHLEAAIGQRQAYISQQLMALREAGIVESRREGRNIFYRIKNLKILNLIQAAGQFNAKESGAFQIAAPEILRGDCPCPKCEADSPENPPVKNSRTLWIEDIQHD
ncbi:MAG: helix-turn-helix transcriptional regulator [Anaerolineales bacterium]|nr:helix-turn-helix transcriptional regulator [Anaerolineales bacterium]